MSILIVDDSSDSRALLATILRKSGYEDSILASSAREAFRILSDEGVSVSLILMDIMMPGVDGIAACRHIKSEKRFQDIPVIMVTAKTDTTFLSAAFDAGAMDYITKPFNKVELLARVKSALTLKREMDIRKEREREIARIGHEIQKTLLLEEPPCHLRELEMAALAIPSQRIDGDFYDFIPYSDTILDVVVADVMGKGIPAAMLGAATKNQLFRAVNRILVESDCDTLPEPHEIVNRVHGEITNELIRLESFVTLFYLRLDTAAGNARFINCGHTGTIHFRCREGRCVILEGENAPLGFSRDEIYRQQSVSFDRGDIFVFYSDGITEAKNSDDEYFGIERLKGCVEGYHDLAPPRLIEAIRDTVTAFSGQHSFSDDVTCVIVKISDVGRAVMKITNRPSQLAGVRAFVGDMCARHGLAPLDDFTVFELKLAVHEALVNVMEHGLGDDDETITVEILPGQAVMTVSIQYRGSEFPPECTGPPKIEDMEERGYGVFLIENMTDRVSCSHDDCGQMRIVLEKDITKAKID